MGAGLAAGSGCVGVIMTIVSASETSFGTGSSEEKES